MGCSAMGCTMGCSAMGCTMVCSAKGDTMGLLGRGRYHGLLGLLGCVGIDAVDYALAINHLCPQLVATSFQGVDLLCRQRARVGAAGFAGSQL